MRRLLVTACAVALIAAAPAPLWRDASSTVPAKEGRGHTMNAKAGDVDRDGDLDLMLAVEYEPNRLLLNDGSGGFTDASTRLPRNPRDSEEVALVDLDGDGDLDVAVGNEDDLRQELYLNDGRGTFTDASGRLGELRVKANAVIAFDADGDRDLDLFFGGDKVSHLLINDGRARFKDESWARLPDTFAGVQDVAAGDIDGDGDLDLALGAEDRNQLYLNDGKGRFTVAPGAALPRAATPEETRDVELFDVDGDKDLDLYFANVQLWNPRAQPTPRLLLNDGKGQYTDVTAQWLPQRAEITLAAQPLDVDGDGRLDLITAAITGLAGPPGGMVRVLRNTGARFEEITEQVMPGGVVANGFDIAAADFDGDGKADLFIASRGGPDRLLLSKP